MRIGNRLTADQGKRFLAAFGGEDLGGRRDDAMIAVLLGCGLRWAEVAGLTVEDIQQREDHWVVADLAGKGGHVRTAPVPTWVKGAVDLWLTAAGISAGPIFRAISNAGRIGTSGLGPLDRIRSGKPVSRFERGLFNTLRDAGPEYPPGHRSSLRCGRPVWKVGHRSTLSLWEVDPPRAKLFGMFGT